MRIYFIKNSFLLSLLGLKAQSVSKRQNSLRLLKRQRQRHRHSAGLIDFYITLTYSLV